MGTLFTSIMDDQAAGKSDQQNEAPFLANLTRLTLCKGWSPPSLLSMPELIAAKMELLQET